METKLRSFTACQFLSKHGLIISDKNAPYVAKCKQTHYCIDTDNGPIKKSTLQKGKNAYAYHITGDIEHFEFRQPDAQWWEAYKQPSVYEAFKLLYDKFKITIEMTFDYNVHMQLNSDVIKIGKLCSYSQNAIEDSIKYCIEEFCRYIDRYSNLQIGTQFKANSNINAYPLGTKYFAISGGYWVKVGDSKFKWCVGAIFNNVGGDWNGTIELPETLKKYMHDED